MLAHKNGCMAWSAKQGISIKDTYTEIGYVTTVSDQKCTVGRGKVRGGMPIGHCG